MIASWGGQLVVYIYMLMLINIFIYNINIYILFILNYINMYSRFSNNPNWV